MAQISMLSSVEICAGAGGQALGLECSGFNHVALVEIERPACETLRVNRPNWNIIEGDVRHFKGDSFKGIELLAGGVPCPPFSKAGKQLGSKDERDLFPEAVRLVDEIRPQAVMLENVRGFLDAMFDDYRNEIKKNFEKLNYWVDLRLLNASDFGVSQLRPRVVFIALKKEIADFFVWPERRREKPLSVGHLLFDLINERNWGGALQWRDYANQVAPTLVGGSRKHGGPDLGPTRSKKAWAALGVDGNGIADLAPEKNFVGMPRLTTRMAARIQGFPENLFKVFRVDEHRIANFFTSPLVGEVDALCAAGEGYLISHQ